MPAYYSDGCKPATAEELRRRLADMCAEYDALSRRLEADLEAANRRADEAEALALAVLLMCIRCANRPLRRV